MDTSIEEHIAQIIKHALVGTEASVLVNGYYDWLLSPNKKPMQLDVYLPDYGVAIEIDGMQHYEYPNNIHASERAFKYQFKKDRIKEELCEKRGVVLKRIGVSMIRGLCSTRLSDVYFIGKTTFLTDRLIAVSDSGDRATREHNMKVVYKWLRAVVQKDEYIEISCAS